MPQIHPSSPRPTRPQARAVRGGAVALFVVLIGCCLGGAGAALAAAGQRGEVWVPPDRTIVDVTGDRSNGFTIDHYDGSSISPPTDSEARAECSEYDRRADRIRCNTEVRTWYRDLREMELTLRYVRTVE